MAWGFGIGHHLLIYLGFIRTSVVDWIPEPGRPFTSVRFIPRSSRYFRVDFRPGRPVIKRFYVAPMAPSAAGALLLLL